jgi:hypothetical protein
MGFFSRRSERDERPLLTATPDDLRRLGEQAFGGASVYPPGLSGLSTSELDRYAMDFLAAAGYPDSSTPAGRVAAERFLDELTAAAELAGDWGFVGAMYVAWNCVTPQSPAANERKLAIIDRALEVLRTDGVSYTAVPPFALDRWTSLHGYGEGGPAGWPSALAYLPVPAADDAPPVEALREGEARKLAQSPAAPANMIYGERRPDGSIQAVVEGPHPDTGVLRRWDWEGLSAPDYPSFLRDLGDRLVTHSTWAHDDLIPYFPCRARSRDQMRIEARGFVVA